MTTAPHYLDLIPYPLATLVHISTRADGSIVQGFALPFADQMYADGLTPMWGIAKQPTPSDRVAGVGHLDVLRVHRDGNRWLVLDGEWTLGATRWRAGDQGREHAQRPGVFILQPDEGWMVVTQLRTLDGVVVDFGGVVAPA